MKSKLFRIGLLFAFVLPLMVACTDNNLPDGTNFDTTDHQTTEFDSWLKENYLKTYNLSFQYKLRDLNSDMSYNLVPARIEKAEEVARLIKYLWFDAYGAVAGENFLKEYGPRIISLYGSAAINPISRTKMLGTAESGIEVSLFEINSLDVMDIPRMNEYYFNTMHHEFAHILHQKRDYPKSFDDISKGNYTPVGWQNNSLNSVLQKGFITQYASSQPQEDFVETISNYLISTDAQWKNLMDKAKSPLNTEDSYDFVDGRYIILYKLSVCSSWLKSSWNIDLEELRQEIMKRQENIEKAFD